MTIERKLALLHEPGGSLPTERKKYDWLYTACQRQE
jgi:hypothetical protein